MNLLPTLFRSRRRPHLAALDQPGFLRVMFVNTSMPVGGAETLLMNLMRSFDRDQICPEFCCLKDFGPIGEELSSEFTGFRNLLAHKYDSRVLPNMIQLFRQRQVDAIVTVGAGDKMFWGRLAGWLAGVPVVLSALHSTGWPDTVGWLNRQLTPITDSFIAVAPEHGRYLVLNEKLPLHKVRVIPNGVDTDRFRPSTKDGERIRRELGLEPEDRLCGVVAALRPEKNLELLLKAFRSVVPLIPSVHLAIVGDGPERQKLTQLAEQWNLADRIHFLGTRRDVPQILNAFDVFALSSRMEANPVSILEALACGVPVVAPNVGSIPDTVQHLSNGRLTRPLDAGDLTQHLVELLQSRDLSRRMGRQGRQDVLSGWTLKHMVNGYTQLIRETYLAKTQQGPAQTSLRLVDASSKTHPIESNNAELSLQSAPPEFATSAFVAAE